LAKEITSNVAYYSKTLGGESTVKTIITHLKVTKINDKIPASKWLSKMDHGQAIANTFHRPVLFLSLEESLTFIPTTTSVEDEKSRKDPIHLMHVNGNHWVLALLKATNGSKTPIPPIIGSTKYASQVTRGWRTELKENFSIYNQDLQSSK